MAVCVVVVVVVAVVVVMAMRAVLVVLFVLFVACVVCVVCVVCNFFLELLSRRLSCRLLDDNSPLFFDLGLLRCCERPLGRLPHHCIAL